MGFVNHLKNQNLSEFLLEVAFGVHIVEGDLAKSVSDGSTVKVQQLLGEAYGKGWKGVSKGLWFRGVRINDNGFKFYPGIMSPGNSDPVQGIDSVFTEDTPHSNTCWIRFDVPADLAANYQDNENNPPEGFRTIIECQLGNIYDANGDVTATGQYLTNAADVAAFLCKIVRRYPNSRINWASLAALRTLLNQTETPDYRTLPEGVGLTGKYYQGTNFQTFVLSRVDPVVEFNLSEGSPAFTLVEDNFSVRWEGWIRPRYSETYTFTVKHDNGARLWINNVLIVNEWQDDGQYPVLTSGDQHSGTIALTADQFYSIKAEWNEGGGPGEFRLSWSSVSETIEVVPQERLYPKNEAIKNYECHIKFIAPTSLDVALSVALNTSNAFYQEADGQLYFYSFDTLEPSFHFDETNINTETINIKPRYSQIEAANLPTRFQAEGLDLDSQYLEKFAPPVFYDVDKTDFSGHIRTRSVDVGNTRRWQALKILKHRARLEAQGWIMEFEGMPQTYPVLQGDLVTVSLAKRGWVDKKFLCWEATDLSIDAGADNRFFKLFEWKEME